MKLPKCLFHCLFIFLFTTQIQSAFCEEQPVRKLVLPSETDASIRDADLHHLVLYRKSSEPGRLLVFLPGTNGVASKGPQAFFDTALQQGYRVVSLSYNNRLAVAQVCRGNELLADAECARKFRNKRVFGHNDTPLIPDQKQDAIVSRLAHLLAYLVKSDPEAGWDSYLQEGEPVWSQIAFAGQSQGGGMSAFIAKKVAIHRVILFSPGWDYSAAGKIANWYSDSSATPPDRWYGAFNAGEAAAQDMEAAFKAMNIPEGHIDRWPSVSSDSRISNHGDGVGNSAHAAHWLEMLGKGN
jgi:acetyl esterase/lipase